MQHPMVVLMKWFHNKWEATNDKGEKKMFEYHEREEAHSWANTPSQAVPTAWVLVSSEEGETTLYKRGVKSSEGLDSERWGDHPRTNAHAFDITIQCVHKGTCNTYERFVGETRQTKEEWVNLDPLEEWH